jgi:hypothetical protein
MHDLLVALIFLAMVAWPAIVTTLPRNDIEDDA